MKYCINCGEQLENHFKFCTACQAKQPETDNLNEPIQQPEAVRSQVHDTNKLSPLDESLEEVFPEGSAEQYGQARRPMKKGTKTLLSTVAAIVVLLICTHFAISKYVDPERKLKAMDQAISDNKEQAFLDQITFDKNALFDKAGYFNYIKDQEWDTVKEQFGEAIEEKDGLAHKLHTNEGERLYELKPKKFLWGLYHTYTLSAIPVAFSVESPFDGTKLSIGNENKILNAGKATEFKAYPGSYKLSAETENMYGVFDQKEKLEISQTNSNDTMIDFGGEMYTFNTDQPEATLVINGKNTNRKLKDFEEIGPFPEGSKVAVQAEWKNSAGKIVKSAKTPVAKAVDNHLVFIFDQTLLSQGPPVEKIDSETAKETVLEFRDSYETALNDKDYSNISTYLLSGSPAEKELKKYISDLTGKEFHYSFIANDIEDVKLVNDFTVKVTAREQFVFTNHKYETTDYDRLKVYTIKMAGSDYKISDIAYVKTKRDKNE